MAESRNEAILENILGADNVLGDPLSRNEKWLQKILGIEVETEPIQSRIEDLLRQIYEQGIHGPTEPIIFKFVGQSSFTLSQETLNSFEGTISYSYDKENWTEWDGQTTLSSINNLIYIKAE